MDWDAEIKALHGQSTATAPLMTAEFASSRLVADGESDSRIAPEIQLQDAAIAALKYRLTPQDGDVEEPAIVAAIWLIPHFDEDHTRQLLDEVVFNLDHPVNQRFIAQALSRLVPSERLEQEILERLKSDNELHIVNALHLVYDIFGWWDDYRMSASARMDIYDAVERLKRKRQLNDYVCEALDVFELPGGNRRP